MTGAASANGQVGDVCGLNADFQPYGFHGHAVDTDTHARSVRVRA